MANTLRQTRRFERTPFTKADTSVALSVGDQLDLILYDLSVRTVTVSAIAEGGRKISWEFLPAQITPTSTNGTMGAAGSVGALAAEGEHIGDDVRSVISAVNTIPPRQEDVIGIATAHFPAPTSPSVHGGGPYALALVSNSN